MVGKHARYLRHAFLLGGEKSAVTCDDAIVLIYDDGLMNQLTSEERSLFICSGEWVLALF